MSTSLSLSPPYTFILSTSFQSSYSVYQLSTSLQSVDCLSTSLSTSLQLSLILSTNLSTSFQPVDLYQPVYLLTIVSYFYCNNLYALQFVQPKTSLYRYARTCLVL